MNGYQRIMAAFEGREPDTVPVMLHNFMTAASEAGYSMARFRKDPRAIARSFIRAVETYGYDGIVMDVDTATLASAVGVPVDDPEDEPARCAGGCIGDLHDIAALDPPDVDGCMRAQVWLEAVERLKDYFHDEVCIRGNADQAPFSLASMMRSPQEWMTDLADASNRTAVIQLLEYCTGATSRFVELMSEAGAHMISNGDSPAGPEMISPEMYRAFALPFEKRVVETAHRTHLPYVLHICGRTEPILEDMVASGADGLELDQKTDASTAGSVIRERCVFIGNIDPVGILARGTVRQVEEQTRNILDAFSGTSKFVLNAGCAIPADTPPENLRAFIQTARQYR